MITKILSDSDKQNFFTGYKAAINKIIFSSEFKHTHLAIQDTVKILKKNFPKNNEYYGNNETTEIQFPKDFVFTKENKISFYMGYLFGASYIYQIIDKYYQESAKAQRANPHNSFIFYDYQKFGELRQVVLNYSHVENIKILPDVVVYALILKGRYNRNIYDIQNNTKSSDWNMDVLRQLVDFCDVVSNPLKSVLNTEKVSHERRPLAINVTSQNKTIGWNDFFNKNFPRNEKDKTMKRRPLAIDVATQTIEIIKKPASFNTKKLETIFDNENGFFINVAGIKFYDEETDTYLISCSLMRKNNRNILVVTLNDSTPFIPKGNYAIDITDFFANLSFCNGVSYKNGSIVIPVISEKLEPINIF
jgi:hypothetical protein